jgi:hypothetical protein
MMGRLSKRHSGIARFLTPCLRNAHQARLAGFRLSLVPRAPESELLAPLREESLATWAKQAPGHQFFPR